MSQLSTNSTSGGSLIPLGTLASQIASQPHALAVITKVGIVVVSPIGLAAIATGVGIAGIAYLAYREEHR
jgi:hypothetical protein